MFGGRFTFWEILMFRGEGGGVQERSGEILGPSKLPRFLGKINLCGVQAMIFSLKSCCQKFTWQRRGNLENRHSSNKIFLRATVQNFRFLGIQVMFLTNKNKLFQHMENYFFAMGWHFLANELQVFMAKNTKNHLPKSHF